MHGTGITMRREPKSHEQDAAIITAAITDPIATMPNTTSITTMADGIADTVAADKLSYIDQS